MEIREVPFIALGGLMEADDVEAAHSVILSACGEKGSFFPLPEETDFQDAFALHEGARKAVVVNSCGTALDICMHLLDIREGDEVITTPLTFIATAGCAAALGARIVFADIDEKTLCLDPGQVEKKITSKTKAIIPVHYAGLAADIDAFQSISERHGIPVIYDAAHSVGTRYKDKPIGAAGMASCYSFQSNKNMTCLGEGGMITTADPEFAERARQKKTFGYIYGGPKLKITSIGFNYRMTKPQLAVGLSQIKKIDRVISERLRRFRRMQELLADVPEIILPAGIQEGHGCHLYIIRIDTDRVSLSRDELQKRLKENFKVGSGIHYPILWSWEAFQSIPHDASLCERAFKASRQVLSLPIFPNTRFEDLDYIAWSIREIIRGEKK